jgi:hypothetical protein
MEWVSFKVSCTHHDGLEDSRLLLGQLLASGTRHGFSAQISLRSRKRCTVQQAVVLNPLASALESSRSPAACFFSPELRAAGKRCTRTGFLRPASDSLIQLRDRDAIFTEPGPTKIGPLSAGGQGDDDVFCLARKPLLQQMCVSSSPSPTLSLGFSFPPLKWEGERDDCLVG